MSRLAALACIVLAAGLPLAGCGDDEGESTPATTTASSDTDAGGTSSADLEKEDAQAKSDAKSAQTSLETYATEHNGSYDGANPNTINEISPVTSDVGVKASGQTYSVTATSASGNTFTVEKSDDGSTTNTCTEAGVGGCDENGEW